MSEQEQEQEEDLTVRSERAPDDQLLSFDHILKTSIELDEVAKRKIEQLLALGSKRLAQDFKEMLNDSVRAVEQNANLLRILRHKLGTEKDE